MATKLIKKGKFLKINQFDPYLGEEEIASVVQTLRDNWITEGKKTEEFQKMLQEYCHAKHAIVLPNGTLSLYVALMILGVGAGDEVVVPDFTFVGSATAVVLTGAKPVFCDVDSSDFNISIESFKRCITKKTKAVMPVHIYGQSADMKAILAVAKEHKIRVVEDAAQGMGVTHGKRHVGTIGDVGCISFFADKTITMGEGGVLLTQDDVLAEKCMYFKNQGRLNRGSFVHPQVGFNFRITDLQAAVGVAQMKKFSYIVDRKMEIEGLYKKFLKDVKEVTFLTETKRGQNIPFRINILVDDPEKVGSYMTSKGIGMRRFFYPLHKQPCFNKTNSSSPVPYPNAMYAFDHGLSLPSGVGLNVEQIEYTCNAIKDYYAGC